MFHRPALVKSKRSRNDEKLCANCVAFPSQGDGGMSTPMTTANPLVTKTTNIKIEWANTNIYMNSNFSYFQQSAQHIFAIIVDTHPIRSLCVSQARNSNLFGNARWIQQPNCRLVSFLFSIPISVGTKSYFKRQTKSALLDAEQKRQKAHKLIDK